MYKTANWSKLESAFIFQCSNGASHPLTSLSSSSAPCASGTIGSAATAADMSSYVWQSSAYFSQRLWRAQQATIIVLASSMLLSFLFRRQRHLPLSLPNAFSTTTRALQTLLLYSSCSALNRPVSGNALRSQFCNG